jgi:hypothetical protein
MQPLDRPRLDEVIQLVEVLRPLTARHAEVRQRRRNLKGPGNALVQHARDLPLKRRTREPTGDDDRDQRVMNEASSSSREGRHARHYALS